MATLKFNIKHYRNDKYFVLEYKGLVIHLDKLCAVNFEHDFTDSKQHITLSVVSQDKKKKTNGKIDYHPGHADFFYFRLQLGITSNQTVFYPKDFINNGDTLCIYIPKYKRVQDAISDLIIENYSLARHKKNDYFFRTNNQRFENRGEFYWAMKYLLLKKFNRLDKAFPSGWIFMKSDY